VRTITNSRFDELFKISIFRDITSELFERGLISETERSKIEARIDREEEKLIAADNGKQHTRETDKA